MEGARASLVVACAIDMLIFFFSLPAHTFVFDGNVGADGVLKQRGCTH